MRGVTGRDFANENDFMSARNPTQPAMCATCPFREGSKHFDFREYLTDSSLTKTRLCHQTGVNALYRTKKKEMICRGARDLQLKRFAEMGFIAAATDEVWEAKCKELGIP